MTDSGSPRVVLALDSAGSACSVAVGLDEKVIAEERIDTMHGQAEALLPLVDRTMRDARQEPAALDLVVATVGPGSFTGIRAGLAAARGITLATGARLLGVTSFEAVAVLAARSACSEARFLLVALDSRREDLYVQFFDPCGDALRGPAAITPVLLGETVAAIIGANPLLIAGDAAQRAAAALAQRRDTPVLEHSAPGAVGTLRAGVRLLRLGNAADAPRPLYLRPPDVTLPQIRQESSRGRI
jgi:tRNA threonylcarbamoyladenosine biosynthesis protein TsaB